jgi:probable F420-dependent oxidoreductase
MTTAGGSGGRRCRVGVQLQPQHTTIGDLRRAWRELDDLGVDSLWVWDHFVPLYGEPDGAHFEAWSLLGAMAVDTRRATIGTLVSAASYRNADLLADLARTVDHLADGRLVLGVGAGWAERDHSEYGYPFGSAGARLRDLDAALVRIRRRLGLLQPPPVGRLPILVGGGGERVTLRLVAEHADAWNSSAPLSRWTRQNGVLDEWCSKVGREPSAIERTALLPRPPDDAELGQWLDAGAQHLVLTSAHPFPAEPVARLVAQLTG